MRERGKKEGEKVRSEYGNDRQKEGKDKRSERSEKA